MPPTSGGPQQPSSKRGLWLLGGLGLLVAAGLVAVLLVVVLPLGGSNDDTTSTPVATSPSTSPSSDPLDSADPSAGPPGTGTSTDDSSSGPAGDGAAAPTDASTQDFCSGFVAFAQDPALNGTDPGSEVTALQRAAAKLASTGTPAGIPADARTGFELFVDTVEQVDGGDSASDLAKLGAGLDGSGQSSIEAFIQYAGTTCASALSGGLG